MQTAVDMIQDRVGRVSALSSFYETEPWRFESDNLFMNAAARVETELTAEEALAVTQEIEREMGRMAKSSGGVYTDRPIDIDLLMYGSVQMNTPSLVLPHPLMHERLFVMQPLAEIAPDVVHPVLGMTMSEILSKLK